jgi:hypothetical protein
MYYFMIFMDIEWDNFKISILSDIACLVVLYTFFVTSVQSSNGLVKSWNNVSVGSV